MPLFEFCRRWRAALSIYTIAVLYPALLSRCLASSVGHDVRAPLEKSPNSFLYQADWKGTHRWIGPDWWANLIYDWYMVNGTVISAAANGRTLCLLPFELASSPGRRFSINVTVAVLHRHRPLPGEIAVGFRIARRGEFHDFRRAVIFPKKRIDAKVNHRGNLVLGTHISRNRLNLLKGPITLTLDAQVIGSFAKLTLTASQPWNTNVKHVQVNLLLPKTFLSGGISLLSNGPSLPPGEKPRVQFAFKHFSLTGDLVHYFPKRSFGPIVWSQYTISGKMLRLQAQLAPMDYSTKVTFWVKQRSSKTWVQVASGSTHPLSRTVVFTVRRWNSQFSVPYEVRTKWQRQEYSWAGRIRKEPTKYERLKIASFSCDSGYLFPLTDVVSQVSRQDPDILFFAGDQIYETNNGFKPILNGPVRLSMLDFFGKYFMFAWTWRDLLKDRPSVILPDDHDVFQENLFGQGGRRLPKRKPISFEAGGYSMPGRWVAAVEQIIMGHLPDPAVNMSLPIGTKARFTSFNYGGVGFAVLEDRKFKSGVLDMTGRTIWSDGGGDADLLGREQEKFLRRWAQDWTGHTMKCALSQTIFATPVTHRGPKLERLRFYLDNGAWPTRARDRVVRILGDNNVLSLHGDQHLGMLLRHGVDSFDDAGYAFMVPGTANGWPRAWWPDMPDGMTPTRRKRFTGRYYDDAKHPINVLAVANPDPKSINLAYGQVSVTELGYTKASGYGLVEFHKRGKLATVKLFRSPTRGRRNQMFPGFPITIHVGGNPEERYYAKKQ